MALTGKCVSATIGIIRQEPRHLPLEVTLTPGLADTSGVAGHGSDTGGKFAGLAGKPPFAPRAKPNSLVGAGWADRLAYEQMDNSDFATSVGSFGGQQFERRLRATFGEPTRIGALLTQLPFRF